jgi:hypothetical protein
LYVVTAGGRSIANLGNIAVSETSAGLQWNGATDAGEAAVPGLYLIIFDDGNRNFVQKVIKE